VSWGSPCRTQPDWSTRQLLLSVWNNTSGSELGFSLQNLARSKWTILKTFGTVHIPASPTILGVLLYNI
jgi:hypothetical protein